MIDSTTKAVADFIKSKAIPLNKISENTNIPNSVLTKALVELNRSLRANEFLAICVALEKDPNDFKILPARPTQIITKQQKTYIY